MVSSGRQFKELSTDAKIISIPLLFAVIHIEVEVTLRCCKNDDLEKTGFES